MNPNYTSTIYVSSNGHDFDYCGTDTCPCATIFFVTTNITILDRYNKISNPQLYTTTDALTVEIRGVNYNYVTNPTHCSMGEISSNLTVDLRYYFNMDYIDSIQDWFDIYQCLIEYQDIHDGLAFWVGQTDESVSFLYSSEWYQGNVITISVEIENMIFENVDFEAIFYNKTFNTQWISWFQVRFCFVIFYLFSFLFSFFYFPFSFFANGSFW